MNTTESPMVAGTSSEPAIELVARVVRRATKQPATARVAALNANMNADQERLARLFAENTRRLAGKPSL